ncbi:MAG: 3-oxo-tetronate kinase, partial [Pseudomonadota bacterium]
MGVFMGAIADDFTGATDLAGLLARSGHRVSLRIGVPEEGTDDDAAPFEVIALKSRTAPVDEAVRQSLEALSFLADRGAQRFFVKYCSTFDSTAKGNIGPVAEAVMDALGAEQTIYCPAFPENGRAIFMGNLFVGEQPLAESSMKDHPLTPMRDSNLMRLLAPQVKRRVGLANRLVVARGAAALKERLSNLAAEGVAHVVVDAVADDDLAVIAEATKDLTVLTGGSAVAMALPGIWQRDGHLTVAGGKAKNPEVAEGAVILSGSCSAMTNQQVAAFKQHGPALMLDPAQLAQNGVEHAAGWLADQPLDATPMIYATAAPDAVREAQALLGPARAGALV